MGLLNGFRLLLATYVPPEDHVTPIVGTLALVFGLIAGFLWLYLETRTNLGRVLRDFDPSLKTLTAAVADVAAKLPGGGTEFAAAADILKQAATSTPANSQLRNVSARALAAAGRSDEAEKIMPISGSDVDSQIDKMFFALYRPGGYADALRISAELGDNPVANSRSDYWRLMAAAFGQKYHNQLTKHAPADELASTRDNVLDAARRAAALDPGEKLQLYWFANPEKSPNPDDDDLADFRNDEEFKNIVGQPTV